MKNLVLIITLSLFTITAFAKDLPNFPFVYASGYANIEVPPDMAEISFQITASDETAAEAQRIVRERSATILSFFAEHGIEQNDITAYEITKRAVYGDMEYKSKKVRGPVGYKINRKISVTLRNLKLYEKFIKKLLAVPNISGNNTSFKRTDREKIEADLIAKACEKSRIKAEQMAKGMGGSLGPVFAISEHDFDAMIYEFRPSSGRYRRRLLPRSPSAVDSEKEFLFVPATINFRGRVTAIFNLLVKD